MLTTEILHLTSQPVTFQWQGRELLPRMAYVLMTPAEVARMAHQLIRMLTFDPDRSIQYIMPVATRYTLKTS